MLKQRINRLFELAKYFFQVTLYLLGIKKRKGVLVYVGLYRGHSFSSIFYKYKACYGFEADPEQFEHIPNYIKYFPNVHLFAKAVSAEDGMITFHISSNGGASSSIGSGFKKDWKSDVKMVKEITVPSINLMNFLMEKEIGVIDDYISDAQGYDLTILKTLEPMIASKSIKTITCEVTKNKYGNIYKDSPDNTFDGFNSFLGDNYECISKGWGILQDGNFEEVPNSWWEFDAKWRVKQ